MNFALPVILFAVFTLLAGGAWWFMMRRPARWSALVERENDFWLSKKIISPALAERMKRWETSRGMRLLAAVMTFFSLLGFLLTLVVAIKVIALQNQPVRLPVNPGLHPAPTMIPRPATNAPHSPPVTTHDARGSTAKRSGRH